MRSQNRRDVDVDADGVHRGEKMVHTVLVF